MDQHLGIHHDPLGEICLRTGQHPGIHNEPARYCQVATIVDAGSVREKLEIQRTKQFWVGVHGHGCDRARSRAVNYFMSLISRVNLKKADIQGNERGTRIRYLV